MRLILNETALINGLNIAEHCSLHQVHEEEKEFEMELAWICEESRKQFERVPEELATEAERNAKEALEADDM